MTRQTAPSEERAAAGRDEVRAAALERVLGNVRRRLAARRTITALVWATAAVAIVALIGRAPGIPTHLPLGVSAGLAVVPFLLAFALAFARFPGLVEIARDVEQRTGLAERLSTALELAREPTSLSTPVGQALMADARRRAATIDARTMVSLASRPTLAGAGVALAAAALWWAMPSLLPQPQVQSSPETIGAVAEAPAPGQTGATIEDIKLMADLVRSQAEIRDEDLLASVAQQLRELAADAGRSRTQEEIDAEFSRLVAQAEVGFGNDIPEWMPTRTGDISSIGRRIADYQARLAEERRLNAEYAAENLATIRRVLAEKEAAGEESLFVRSGPQTGRNDGPIQEGDPAAPGPSLEELVAMDMAAVLGGAMPALDPNAGPQSLDAANAMPAGGSQQSEGGGGEAAGRGAEELAGTDGITEIPPAPGNEMILTAAELDQGDRIRVHVAPETGRGTVRSDETAVFAGGGAAGSSKVQLRDQVALGERDAVARYFSPWGVGGEREPK